MQKEHWPLRKGLLRGQHASWKPRCSLRETTPSDGARKMASPEVKSYAARSAPRNHEERAPHTIRVATDQRPESQRGEHVGQVEPCASRWGVGHVRWCRRCGKHYSYSKNKTKTKTLKVKLPYGPATTLLGMDSREVKAGRGTGTARARSWRR